MSAGNAAANGARSGAAGNARSQLDTSSSALAGTGLPDGLLRYRLTFTAPGDFSYFCAIHDEAGMRATIHVVP
jgi:hypothetical protein